MRDGDTTTFGRLQKGDQFKLAAEDNESYTKVSTSAYKDSNGKKYKYNAPKDATVYFIERYDDMKESGPKSWGGGMAQHHKRKVKQSELSKLRKASSGLKHGTKKAIEADVRSAMQKGLDVEGAIKRLLSRSKGSFETSDVEAYVRLLYATVNEQDDSDYNLSELAKSELQRKAAGVALQAKRSGNTSNLRKGSAAERMYNDMTEKQLADFAAGVEDGYVPAGDVMKDGYVMSESNIDDTNEQSNVTLDEHTNLTFTYTPDVTSKVEFIANSAEARGLNVTIGNGNVTCEGNITQHSALMRAMSNVGVGGYVNEGASSLPNHPLASTFQSLHRALTKTTYQAQSYDANTPAEKNPTHLSEEDGSNDPFKAIRERYRHFNYNPDAPYTNPRTIDEGKWSKIMRGVKKGGGGPWTIMAIVNGKVVDQQHTKTMDAIPAFYEDVKKKYPNAKIGIEDGGGQIVYTEGINEGLDEGMGSMGDPTGWMKNRKKQTDDIESMMRNSSKEDNVTYGQITINGVSNYDQKTVKRILKKHKFTVDQIAGAFVDMSTTKPIRNVNKLKADITKDLMNAIPEITRVGVNIFGG